MTRISWSLLLVEEKWKELERFAGISTEINGRGKRERVKRERERKQGKMAC